MVTGFGVRDVHVPGLDIGSHAIGAVSYVGGRGVPLNTGGVVVVVLCRDYSASFAAIADHTGVCGSVDDVTVGFGL